MIFQSKKYSEINLSQRIKRTGIFYSLFCSIFCHTTAGATGITIFSDTLPADTAKGLREVVVTAQEGRHTTSTSIIDTVAMKHLQPSSFTDLLELIPGNVTKDPAMGQVNTINLRQATNVTPTADYATSSLGTSFVIDGVRLSTTAQMQTTPDADQSGRMSTGMGVDMRAIATDDIEKVEIVRGIPSVEYGELTSGLVKIKRKSGVSRLQARFKADNQSQLVSLTKGLRMPGNNWILNVGLNLLDSRIDPRNSRESFRRLGTSLRSDKRWNTENYSLKWNSDFSYSMIGEKDNADPDLTVNNTIDEFSTTRHNLSWNNTLRFNPVQSRALRDITFVAGLSYACEHLRQRKHVAASRVMPMPVSLTPGSNYVGYLPMLYIADYDVYGKPFSTFTRLSGSMRFYSEYITSNLKAGVEWNMDKNYGRGTVYDINRPLTAGNTARPRAFSDIPAINQISAYAENVFRYLPGAHTLGLTLGLRETQLVGLDRRYALNGKPYLDPRINAVWIPAPTEAGDFPITWELAAGYGWHTKMPVAAYLFPDLLYTDIEQLNYYHNEPDFRTMNVMTYVEDLTNYGLRAARNVKWEIRGDVSYRGNRLSVTYFRENMSDGFRYTPQVHRYSYRRYDASGFDPFATGRAPMIDELPYQDLTYQTVRSHVTNGSRTRKSGVEYTFQSRRFAAIRTRVTVTGAYLRTINNNSCPLWYKPNIVVNNRELQYLGLYDDTDGSKYQSFNTNILFDTDIASLSLNFSFGIQNMWFTSRQTLFRTGIPVAYMDPEGTIHPYTVDMISDPYLGQLVRNFSSTAFEKLTVPTATTFNFKATKTFRKQRIGIAIYVNRLFSIMPDYERYGVTIRRYSSPYFGMELNLRI